MIECIFTLDYEIYGNGSGALRPLVYEPADKLRQIFDRWRARFVNFVEVSEFRQIDIRQTDPGIGDVKRQIQEFYRDGFEIGLHLHPQWSKARHENGKWILDYEEYNLCKLPASRISQIVEESVDYLRDAVGDAKFTPVSFRAGNWLFQPCEIAASVLADMGIRIDSSVFKGGRQHNHSLDYRPASKNGYYWSFSTDVNQSDPVGKWLELPIYTEMVPFWKMSTSKRMRFAGGVAMNSQGLVQKLNRWRDLLRFRYPRKLDFCRMTLEEMTSTLERIAREDEEIPDVYRPIVLIGHTKDLIDLETIDALLGFLHKKNIGITTLDAAQKKILQRVA